MTRGLALAVALWLVQDGPTVTDATGVPRRPLTPPGGGLAVAFFVAHDCPISNHYARTIRRICDSYATRGVRCSLVYVDPSLSDAAALEHAREYGHGRYPVIVDRTHALVRAAGVRVAPEAAVLDDRGRVAYRGRIDDFYAAWGTPRRVVRDHSLRRALDALLEGRPAPQPRTEAVGCFIDDLAR